MRKGERKLTFYMRNIILISIYPVEFTLQILEQQPKIKMYTVNAWEVSQYSLSVKF